MHKLHTVHQQALLFIRHVQGSNLGQKTSYLDRDILWYSPAPLANRQAMYSSSLYRYPTVRTTQSTVQQTTFPLVTAGTDRLLGAFAKLRRATISFLMYVRPSVRMEQIGSHWTDFN
jgi:hypothetical protein